MHHNFRFISEKSSNQLEKGTSIKIPKSFAKNATYLIHYILVLKIKIQNMYWTPSLGVKTAKIGLPWIFVNTHWATIVNKYLSYCNI